MHDLIELQHKLESARNSEDPKPVDKYRMRTAAQDDAAKLLKSGMFTPNEISYYLGIRLASVEREQARIQEQDAAIRKFQITGEVQGQPPRFAIHQGRNVCLYH